MYVFLCVQVSSPPPCPLSLSLSFRVSLCFSLSHLCYFSLALFLSVLLSVCLLVGWSSCKPRSVAHTHHLPLSPTSACVFCPMHLPLCVIQVVCLGVLCTCMYTRTCVRSDSDIDRRHGPNCAGHHSCED